LFGVLRWNLGSTRRIRRIIVLNALRRRLRNISASLSDEFRYRFEHARPPDL
jgi:hypothetical protein